MKYIKLIYKKINFSLILDQFWLLVEMTLVELKSKYKNTYLGFGWTVIHPIIQTIVMSFTLSHFLKVNGNYSLFLFSGLLVWNFFSLSIIEGTNSLIDKRDIIHKSYFSYFIIPTATVFSHFIRLLFSTIFLFLYSYYLGFVVNIGYYIFSLVILLFLTINTSIILSFWNVIRRDIGFIVNSLVYLVFYITPIIYDVYFLPEFVKKIIVFNPLSEILILFRNSFSFSYNVNYLYSYFLLIFNIILFLLVVKISKKKSHNLGDFL